MTARVVRCVKLKEELPGLERAPFPSPLGQRIFDSVSARAWELWDEQARTLMNHHGLSMADPEARRFLRAEMEKFLFGDGDATTFSEKPQ